MRYWAAPALRTDQPGGTGESRFTGCREECRVPRKCRRDAETRATLPELWDVTLTLKARGLVKAPSQRAAGRRMAWVAGTGQRHMGLSSQPFTAEDPGLPSVLAAPSGKNKT